MTAKSGDLLPVVSAAQRVAGLVAARGRGDRDGARELLRGLSEDDLQAGALLVADLSLNLLQRETGDTLDETVARLCIEIEHAVHEATGLEES